MIPKSWGTLPSLGGRWGLSDFLLIMPQPPCFPCRLLQEGTRHHLDPSSPLILATHVPILHRDPRRGTSRAAGADLWYILRTIRAMGSCCAEKTAEGGTPRCGGSKEEFHFVNNVPHYGQNLRRPSGRIKFGVRHPSRRAGEPWAFHAGRVAGADETIGGAMCLVRRQVRIWTSEP